MARSGDVLTRDQVVKAAVAVVDRGGLADLSMRNVAAQLNVGVTTLYWHVADKDELLDLVCDDVLGEVVLSGGERGSWDAQLRQVMTELRLVFLRHKDLATLLPTRDVVGPHALRLRESVAASLMSAGLPSTLLAGADHTLLAYVLGFVAAEVGAAAAAVERGADVDAVLAEETSYLAALSPADYPALTTLASHSSAHDRNASFAFGLQLILDGIAAQVPASKQRGARRRPA